MKAKGKKSPNYTFASAEVMDAAATIAALKGDDIDRLLGDFVNGYVTDNLHVLTQKAQENRSQTAEILSTVSDGSVKDGRNQNS